jgi:hypothetical protein
MVLAGVDAMVIADGDNGFNRLMVQPLKLPGFLMHCSMPGPSFHKAQPLISSLLSQVVYLHICIFIIEPVPSGRLKSMPRWKSCDAQTLRC